MKKINMLEECEFEKLKKQFELYFGEGIVPKNNYGDAPYWFRIENVCWDDSGFQIELMGHGDFKTNIFYPGGLSDEQENYLSIRLDLIKKTTEYRDDYKVITLDRRYDPESVKLFYKKIILIDNPVFIDAAYQVLRHWRFFYEIRSTLFEWLSALKKELKAMQ